MVNPVRMESKKGAAWPKLHGEENKLLREQLSDFCQQTSFTVLVNIYRASNILKKLAWCVTFLACLGWLSFQCYYLLDRYFSYPFDVTMQVQTVTELEFPSVTVCNMNPLKSSLIKKGPLRSLDKFTKDNFKEDNRLYDEALDFYGTSINIGKRQGPNGPSGDGNHESPDFPDDDEPKPESGSGPSEPSTMEEQWMTNTGGTGPPDTQNPTSMPVQASTTKQGTTSNPSPEQTAPQGPGPTGTQNPTGTSAAVQSTTAAQGPTSNAGQSSATTPSQGTEPTTKAGSTTQSMNTDMYSTTADWYGHDPTSQMDNSFLTTFDPSLDYYDSMSEYLKTKNFNQWDMLETRNVTNFYTTPDSELDAALMYAQLSAKVSEDEVLETGHSLKDFMISCKFGGFPCSPHNFTAFHNHKYGNCYTFNHPERIKSAKTRFAGPLYGLTLELYLEQDDYVPALSQEAGVRVVIHSRKGTPFPEDEGVSVAPGYATSIGLEALEMVRLGPPHSDCATNGTTEDLYQLNSAYDYSKISCMKSCYQKLIKDECGCETPNYYIENRDAVCNLTNEDTAWCVMNIEGIRQAEYKSCNAKCPPACVEMKYEKSISAAEWPSNNYKDQLTSRFQTSRSVFMSGLNLGGDQIKDFVKIRVYFQEMVYKRIEATKSYESMNLISDIGGQLGLWLGLSAITIGELCSVMLLVVRGLSSKMCASKTTPVEKVKLDQLT